MAHPTRGVVSARALRLGAQAAVLAVVVSATSAFATLHKSVELDVNGQTVAVETFGRTVGDVLVAAGVEVGDRDLVVPGVGEPAPRGAEILVRHAREIDVVIDGEPRTVWTTALTVGDAIDALGVRSSEALVSTSRSAPVARSGPVTVSTVKTLTVAVDGQLVDVTSNAPTVRAALRDVGLVLDAGDQVSVPLDASVVDGLVVVVTRAQTTAGSAVETIAFAEREVEDASLARGTRIVQQQGQVGERRITYNATVVGGVEVDRQVVASVVVAEPQDRVTRVGTMVVPQAPAVSPGTAQAIGRQMVHDRGWGDDEWACLHSLWQRESGWRVNAENRSSGAYGIPQAHPGTKMASAGADWRTNPETQIRWGLSYISNRYGTPCGAWGFFLERNWY